MITRYNYKWEKPVKKCNDVKLEYELITQIEPISYMDDSKKVVKEYREIWSYNVKKKSWREFIKSFDLGSIKEQLFSHIYKGTPLVTAHTLPAGDYTDASLLKGAEIVREMNAKGVTLDMLISAFNSKKEEKPSSESEAK